MLYCGRSRFYYIPLKNVVLEQTVGSSAVKNLSTMQETTCNSGELRGSPGVRNGNPLQYSCLANPMDRGAWRAPVHGVARFRHNLVTKPPPPQVDWSQNANLVFCVAILTSVHLPLAQLPEVCPTQAMSGRDKGPVYKQNLNLTVSGLPFSEFLSHFPAFVVSSNFAFCTDWSLPTDWKCWKKKESWCIGSSSIIPFFHLLLLL